jgi:hypothetical protein
VTRESRLLQLTRPINDILGHHRRIYILANILQSSGALFEMRKLINPHRSGRVVVRNHYYPKTAPLTEPAKQAIENKVFFHRHSFEKRKPTTAFGMWQLTKSLSGGFGLQGALCNRDAYVSYLQSTVQAGRSPVQHGAVPAWCSDGSQLAGTSLVSGNGA